MQNVVKFCNIFYLTHTKKKVYHIDENSVSWIKRNFSENLQQYGQFFKENNCVEVEFQKNNLTSFCVKLSVRY